MNISNELRKELIQNGASIAGFADLYSIPEKVRQGFAYGISIGIALNPHAVAKIEQGPNLEYYNEYRYANNLLNELAEHIAEFLLGKGFFAFPQTQSNVIVNPVNRRSVLPHKTVATLAGLGWTGKSTLLITEKYGAAIRISSVLTNANLEVEKKLKNPQCDDCFNCVNVCPAKAISGKVWSKTTDRDELINASACKNEVMERGINLKLTDGTCGLCMWVCPWTQKYLRKGV